MRRLAPVALLGGLLFTACGTPTDDARILFPLPGAVLDSPVKLEANRPGTWRIRGEVFGTGRQASLSAAPGPQTVTFEPEAGGLVQTLEVTVSDPFPSGVPKRVNVSGGTLTLPAGTFSVILGNPAERIWRGEVQSSREAEQEALTPQTTSGERTRAASPPDPAAFQESQVRRLVQRGVQAARPPFQAQEVSPPPARSRTIQMPDLVRGGSRPVQAELVWSGPGVAAYGEHPERWSLETRAAVQTISARFAATLWPRTQATFGAASDVDGDGRVLLLFSAHLNETQQAVGLFNPADLFAPGPDNADSNGAEVLFLGLPTPNDLNFSAASLTATACHEGTHLIHLARKTLSRLDDPDPPVEELALSEGLAHLAEDLCGYGQSGGNGAFVAAYLARAAQTSLTGVDLAGVGDSVARRGAAYLLLRRAYEQMPRGWAQRLVSSPETGLSGLAQTTGQTPTALQEDLWWTLALAGRLPGPAHRFAPQHPDPETGDLSGIDLTAGRVSIGELAQVTLQGLPEARSWPRALPGGALVYRRLSGEQTLNGLDGLLVLVRREEPETVRAKR